MDNEDYYQSEAYRAYRAAAGMTVDNDAIPLRALDGFDLTVTFNGLVAVRCSCRELMVLPAGLTDLTDAVRLAIAHTCHT